MFWFVLQAVAAWGLGVATCFMFALGVSRSNKERKKRFAKYEVMPAGYAHNKDGSNCRIACPKCDLYGAHSARGNYCADDCYPVGHFHYECPTCHFKAFMQTADDTTDNLTLVAREKVRLGE